MTAEKGRGMHLISSGAMSPSLPPSVPFDGLSTIVGLAIGTLQSPAYLWADMIGRLFSPYDLNPQNLNPLRDFLQKISTSLQYVRRSRSRLFVSATNARTGEIRVFDREEITSEVLLGIGMPAAGLPERCEIEGDPYWDGGYMGNPASTH